MDFTPEQKIDAISKRVEGQLGPVLEDLVTAAWLVYGLTRTDPNELPHQTAVGVINTFELHNFGWQKSHFIPRRGLLFEGKDRTLEARIDEYCALAKKHQDELQPNLVMLLGYVYWLSKDTPEELMHQWALAAMKRNDIRPGVYDEARSSPPTLVLPDSERLQ